MVDYKCRQAVLRRLCCPFLLYQLDNLKQMDDGEEWNYRKFLRPILPSIWELSLLGPVEDSQQLPLNNCHQSFFPNSYGKASDSDDSLFLAQPHSQNVYNCFEKNCEMEKQEDARSQESPILHDNHVFEAEKFLFQMPSRASQQQNSSQLCSPPFDRLESRQNKETTKRGTTKNQYDKNIVGNICSTVIRKMLQTQSEREIKFYCDNLGVKYRDFFEYFRNRMRRNIRFGTSQLYKFFSREGPQEYQEVFGLFLIRFLDEQYLSYALGAGKMSQEHKYLECASKLMFVPHLTKQSTDLISQFHQLV